jgi:hypothetical protein
MRHVVGFGDLSSVAFGFRQAGCRVLYEAASFVHLVQLRHRLAFQRGFSACTDLLYQPAMNTFTVVGVSLERLFLPMSSANISVSRGNNDGNTPSNDSTMPPLVSSADSHASY